MTESKTMSDFILPSGDDLRIFLTQEAITASMVRSVLRRRGIFLSCSEKKDMLGHILLSFLTPNEFEFLIDSLKTREDSHKYRSRTYNIAVTNHTLAEMLPVELPLEKIAIDEYGNWKIHGIPAFMRDDLGDKESYVIKYKTERRNLSADWVHARRIFEGEVRYTYDQQNLLLEVTAIHTSSETERANKMLMSHVKGRLSERKLLATGEEQAITFASFQNEQRILFFMKFTGFNEADGIRFDCVTDISLRHDPSKGVPTQPWLTWLNKNVEKVLLSGSSLQDTDFVRDRSSWPHLIIWRMEAKFTFETVDFDGSFRGVFEFSDYATTKLGSAEFQISIPNLTINDKSGKSADISRLKKSFTIRLNADKRAFYELALKYSVAKALPHSQLSA